MEAHYISLSKLRSCCKEKRCCLADLLMIFVSKSTMSKNHFLMLKFLSNSGVISIHQIQKYFLNFLKGENKDFFVLQLKYFQTIIICF